MIDHVGFSVSDYARAKAFYERALAPLGYTLIMEATAQETGQPAAGFGSGGKPDFWIGGEGKLEKPVHIAITAKDRLAAIPLPTFCKKFRFRNAAKLLSPATIIQWDRRPLCQR
jgi:catechol 2,3-dioxygenase-like lactoylglutathione lyase family enzyme